jgi:predicted TIM-barrel fold metal-dependent hydrolase
MRWSEDTDITFFTMDAFIWTTYWGDRPAIETVWAFASHGLVERFPKLRVVLSEMGSVGGLHGPQDGPCVHAGQAGHLRELARRPSETFREHFFVAPSPQESVSRVTEVVGVEPVVLGSDFPTGRAPPVRTSTQRLSSVASAPTR